MKSVGEAAKGKVIVIHDLVKRFKDVTAVGRLNLERTQYRFE